MPKLKTKKSIKKRMKITKSGKVLRRKPGGRHYKAGKSSGRRRRLRGTDLVVGKRAKTMLVLLAPGS
ncbi:MAG: 50S ribosomal protein L35 [Planctomycetota bacterium]